MDLEKASIPSEWFFSKLGLFRKSHMAILQLITLKGPVLAIVSVDD